MSKTLLIIASHAAAREQVFWTWPYYQIPGWDICGVCPTDSNHHWPAGIAHIWAVGLSGYSTPNLIKRWVATWEKFLTWPGFDVYSDACFIEYDSFFLAKPPQHNGGLYTNLAGGGLGGTFKASRFFHTPWWADRGSAAIIVDEGHRLIEAGEFENGSPDVFLGLIADRRPELNIFQTETWSCNGNDFQNRKEHALRAIDERSGLWFVHGVRTREELDLCVTQELKAHGLL